MNLNKRGVSPLVATILLVIFSLILGTITMNLGKAYIEEITEIDTGSTEDTSLKYIGDALYRCQHLDEVTNTCLSWALVD